MFIDFLKQESLTGRSGKQYAFGANSASTDNNLRVIANLFQEKAPVLTLEVGLCHGISASLFASLHANNEQKGKHVAIDPFQNDGWDRTGLNALESSGLIDHIEFHEDYSSTVLAELVKQERTFDIIYIDGSHLFEDVFVDFFYCQRLLKVGGIILFDDASTKDVSKVVRFIDRNYKHTLQRIDISKYQTMSTLKKALYPIASQLYKVQLAGFEKINSDHNRHWSASMSNF